MFGRSGTRNAPALINRGYGASFFWDGRTTTLEEQVLRPIEDPKEMGSNAVAAAARVGLTPEALAAALATYVRSVLAGDSPSIAMWRATVRRWIRSSWQVCACSERKGTAPPATSVRPSPTSGSTTRASRCATES